MTASVWHHRFNAIFAGCMFALLACLSGAVSAQANKLVVAIGTAPPDLSLQTYYFAQENGFYKAEGLDVVLMPFNGDATATRSCRVMAPPANCSRWRSSRPTW